MGIKEAEKNYKIEALYAVLNRWLTLKEKNIKICNILARMNVKNICIFGVGAVCVHLIEELKNTQIQVVFIADVGSGTMYDGRKVVDLETIDKCESVDICIYTNPCISDVLKKIIYKKMNCRLLGIDELLFEMI